MRNSISHPKNVFEGIRLHYPTKLLCLSPKNKCAREITSLTGSSSHEELNRPGTFGAKSATHVYRGIAHVPMQFERVIEGPCRLCVQTPLSRRAILTASYRDAVVRGPPCCWIPTVFITPALPHLCHINNIQVKYEFEDFMAVPGCCTGFHDDASGDFINQPRAA